MIFSIPHCDLTESEKRENEAIMREGNSLMKFWAAKFYNKNNCATRLRRGIFHWAIDPKDPEAIDPKDVGIPQSDLDVIMKVRTIESKVLFGYARMVANIAKRLKWSLKYTYLDFDDLLLEGFVAVRDAVYSFSNFEAEFTTYTHWIIRRRLFRKINSATDFGGFTTAGFKLLTSYNIAKLKLERKLGCKVQVETVAADMGLDSKAISHLHSMLCRCVRASSLTNRDGSNNPYENVGGLPDRELDVSILLESMKDRGINEVNQGVILAAAKGQIPYQEATRLVLNQGKTSSDRANLISKIGTSESEFMAAVEKANLSPIETDLVMAAVRGERYFQSRIAARYINPETNTPYSRMSGTNFLRTALAKIQGKHKPRKRKETVAA